jgi:serine/threonine protein kinase
VDADVVITDFGLSAIVADSEERLKRAVGTPGYLAPEVLETLETDEGYGREVDLWGVGVILYILLCGFPPFYGEDDEEVYDKICDGDYAYPSPYWDSISDSAKELIDHLLVLDPRARFTVQQALAHPWIKEHAPDRHLDTALEELAKFNARRKLKVCCVC